MPRIDMSAKAVTARLKRVAQLRNLGLSLQKAKIMKEETEPRKVEAHNGKQAEPGRQGSR